MCNNGDNRPWKVMYDGCCIKRYKAKWAAIRYGKMKLLHLPKGSKVCISSDFDLIEI
jgi:hypothetical protein